MSVLHEYSALFVHVKKRASLLSFEQEYCMLLEKMFQCAEDTHPGTKASKKGISMKKEPEDNLQNKVYAFITAFIGVQGMPPTIREIGRTVNVESTGHIDHILRMRRSSWD